MWKLGRWTGAADWAAAAQYLQRPRLVEPVQAPAVDPKHSNCTLALHDSPAPAWTRPLTAHPHLHSPRSLALAAATSATLSTLAPSPSPPIRSLPPSSSPHCCCAHAPSAVVAALSRCSPPQSTPSFCCFCSSWLPLSVFVITRSDLD